MFIILYYHIILYYYIAGKACNFIRKRLQHVLSCEIYEISKRTYFEEHLRMAACKSFLYQL